MPENGQLLAAYIDSLCLPAEQPRRLLDGSIDYALYRRRARLLHGAAIRRCVYVAFGTLWRVAVKAVRSLRNMTARNESVPVAAE